MWQILGVVAFLILVFYFFKGRNAVWGMFTLGVILGVGAAILNLFLEGSFRLELIGKVAAICILLGFVFELLGTAGDRLRKRM